MSQERQHRVGGERNFRIRGQRLRQGNSVQAAKSWGGLEPVFPPRGRVNLKKPQREPTDCDFLQGGFRNYQ